MLKNNKSKKGFTLIELMVVIVIIAILAVFAVPRVERFITEAKETKLLADFKSVNDSFKIATTSWISDSSSNKFPHEFIILGSNSARRSNLLSFEKELSEILDPGHKIVSKNLIYPPDIPGGKCDDDPNTWEILFFGDGESYGDVYIVNEGYYSRNFGKLLEMK